MYVPMYCKVMAEKYHVCKNKENCVKIVLYTYSIQYRIQAEKIKKAIFFKQIDNITISMFCDTCLEDRILYFDIIIFIHEHFVRMVIAMLLFVCYCESMGSELAFSNKLPCYSLMPGGPKVVEPAYI